MMSICAISKLRMCNYLPISDLNLTITPNSDPDPNHNQTTMLTLFKSRRAFWKLRRLNLSLIHI